MTNIKINKDKEYKGRLTVHRYKDENGSIRIEGQLFLYRYIDEINEIELPRIKITNIDVVDESFGSEDYGIVYTFSAGNIEISNNLLVDVAIEELEKKDDKNE